ncbi:hypothetical protein N824_01325 [Pedobacter sp. V48]|nr:hypothetical protein N824_01325 [Pedobacter sp. V48]
MVLVFVSLRSGACHNFTTDLKVEELPDFTTQNYTPLYWPQSSNVKEVSRNVNQPAVDPERSPAQEGDKKELKQ